jgi:6-phosphogluconolactonase
VTTSTLRGVSGFILPLILMLPLAGCGSSGSSGTVVCNASSGSSCTKPGMGPEILYGFPAAVLLNTSMTATINPNTGGLSSISIETVPFFGSSVAAAPNAQFLYASAGLQIFGYSIGQTNGTLTPIAGSPFSFPSNASIQGLATAPNSQFLYAADVAGSIDAFSVDSVTGVPTSIPGSPFASGLNYQLVVDPSGKFLFASDDDPPGGILAFTIDSTGVLTPVSGSPFAIPGQTVANSEPFGIVDSGSFVYAALTAANQIAAFSIDSVTGALSPVPGSPFSAGDQPTTLTSTNNFLYAANWTNGSISGYSISPSSGALTAIPGSPFGSNITTLAADPSGKYLYVGTSLGTLDFDINYAGSRKWKEVVRHSKHSSMERKSGNLLIGKVETRRHPDLAGTRFNLKPINKLPDYPMPSPML